MNKVAPVFTFLLGILSWGVIISGIVIVRELLK